MKKTTMIVLGLLAFANAILLSVVSALLILVSDKVTIDTIFIKDVDARLVLVASALLAMLILLFTVLFRQPNNKAFIFFLFLAILSVFIGYLMLPAALILMIMALWHKLAKEQKDVREISQQE